MKGQRKKVRKRGSRIDSPNGTRRGELTVAAPIFRPLWPTWQPTQARWMSLVLAGPGCERELCWAGKNRNMTTLDGTCSVGNGINQCLVRWRGAEFVWAAPSIHHTNRSIGFCDGLFMWWRWYEMVLEQCLHDIFSCALLSIKHWMRRINDPSGVDFWDFCLRNNSSGLACACGDGQKACLDKVSQAGTTLLAAGPQWCLILFFPSVPFIFLLRFFLLHPRSCHSCFFFKSVLALGREFFLILSPCSESPTITLHSF